MYSFPFQEDVKFFDEMSGNPVHLHIGSPIFYNKVQMKSKKEYVFTSMEVH